MKLKKKILFPFIIVEALLLFSMCDFVPAYNHDKVTDLLNKSEYAPADYSVILQQLKATSAILESENTDMTDEQQESLFNERIALEDAMIQGEELGMLDKPTLRAYHKWLDNNGANDSDNE